MEKDQKGFGVLKIFVIIILVGAITLVGWVVWGSKDEIKNPDLNSLRGREELTDCDLADLRQQGKEIVEGVDYKYVHSSDRNRVTAVCAPIDLLK